MSLEKESTAIENFEKHIIAALEASKDAHHLGGNLSYLRSVFDRALNDYIAKEYAINTEYSRDLSRTEKLRRELKPRHKKIVLERDQYRCVHCDSHKNLCVDHKTPIAKGGDNSTSNLQTLCRSCNSSKGAKSMSEWLGEPQ